MSTASSPLVLIVLDGWGIAPPGPGNAISLAKPANFNRFWEEFPHTQLQASSKAVGLPEGADGNSEVGHLNLGAGRIVLQDVKRINQAIDNGIFFQNQAFLKAINHAKKEDSQLHLLGLIGGGVVHSANQHLFALLKLAKQQNFSQVKIHLFTDGRDSPPKSALKYLKELNQVISHTGIGQVASIMGRYWAMDRDQRWERTQKAYQALTQGEGFKVPSSEEAIEKAYERGETDEFIKPTLINQSGQNPPISDSDSLIFFNFRVDRVRQLVKAFVINDFETKAHQTGFNLKENPMLAKQVAEKKRHPVFKRKRILKNLWVTTMTTYEKDLSVSAIAFPERLIDQPLGQVLAEAGLTQLRAAETEKERFVTYYFNGFRTQPFPKEEHLIIPSPPVATYDLQPEMSAYLLADKFLKKLEEKQYDFCFLNFANPDMVGHTGDVEAAIQAVEAVDECLGSIVDYVLGQEGTVLITADHGNVEEMIEASTGGIDTKHSTSPVPLILARQNWQDNPVVLPQGILGDVAPTILDLLDLDQPQIMTGKSLVNQLQ